MPRPYTRVEAGNTIQFTWVASITPDSLNLAVKDADGTIINSGQAVSSGPTAFYRFVTIPASWASFPRVMQAEWTAVTSTQAGSTSPFITRMNFDVIKTEPWGGALS